MNNAPWNAAALARRRWIMERLTEAAANDEPMPTTQELSKATGKTHSIIAYDLTQLERHGYIARSFGRSRSIRVLIPFLSGTVETRKADAA